MLAVVYNLSLQDIVVEVSFKDFLLPGGLAVNYSIGSGQVVLVASYVADAPGINSADNTLYRNPRLLLLSMCGCYHKYTGHIAVNGYPVRYNIMQMRENVQLVPASCTMRSGIPPAEQLRMLSSRWSGIDVSLAAIRSMGLDHLCRTSSPTQLTSAQKKMFELAVLTACPATIWLLDRPDNGLDESGISVLRDLIEHRASQGGIVFLVGVGERLLELTTSTMRV